jgi:hypothetical protein
MRPERGDQAISFSSRVCGAGEAIEDPGRTAAIHLPKCFRLHLSVLAALIALVACGLIGDALLGAAPTKPPPSSRLHAVTLTQLRSFTVHQTVIPATPLIGGRYIS